MQLRGAAAVLATALTIGGASVRAEQAGSSPAPLTVPPLRFSLHPKDLPAATMATRTTGEWNCGMPVVRPPADIDPAIERKPDHRRSVPIRRATLPSCGR